ncbi:restriction endonuclease subunit S [Irregularibacter muris]|uniref:Restriction endonuclease subunit S n=1 Tax=Irregularibacter muris TaxID=1796619 RepID=A0AAE3HCG0_9FIRM|nr:restriction endonuclease subunit S [Irregularibacter muris]MCR1897381.1 restriction endonuclease subunit S [Irregularibacter muris]
MEYRRLGDYVRIMTGKLDANASDKDGKYPFFTCSVNNLWINSYAYDCECVLVAGNGDLNVKYYEGKFNAYQRTYIIESMDKNILDIKFLYYFMSKYIDILRNGSIGGVIKYIKLGDLSEAQIPLPSLQIQERIVEVLGKAQASIDARKEQITLLDEYIQSIFYEMFGDPITNSKGWEIRTLKEVGNLQRGKSKHRPRNAPELLGGPYPFVQTGDIANAGLYINNYFQTYSELGLKQSKMWSKGTLCITIAANIAKTTILGFDACFPDSIVAFIPTEKVDNMYVQLWFRFLQEIIEASAPESAQKNINLRILNDLDIPIPPIHFQNQFANIVQKIEAQKQLMEKSLVEMENNFNSLMQRAFKGELFS